MNESETNKNLSTQKILVAGHDPGWNDPPKWAYSGAQSSASTPTKRTFNKRVAFPLAPTQIVNKDSSSQNASTAMPPPLQSSTNLTTASHPPLMLPTNIEGKINELKIDKEQALSDVLSNFEVVIEEYVLEKSKAEEVKKRLDVLKVAWLEDKLNSAIHEKILDLSTALRKGDIENADRIHVALMMQYATLCSPWIPGIRHIILGLKAKLKNSNAMESQNSESELLPVDVKE
ncbi:steroid receptor RNA activator 1-like [Hylaeus volcanicus]|uniref:steroid receptor RNA activator 1-like n=1 Tax=Hylaeus volcanicus TaxID=313075 RepID=UPI0023B79D86|nr:steroid receptor RNA activator 1-like [Hylaeus volcanicus]